MFPLKVPAIRIEQPLGVFYVASIPASILLDTCHSIKVELLDEVDEVTSGSLGKMVDVLRGTQREKKLDRLAQIRRYTETVDACFPNAIILGANYDRAGVLVKDDKLRWRVEDSGLEGDSKNEFYYLRIPTEEKLASIIDGQHRVFGFSESENKGMHLLCSVFIDLPMPYHAELFTRINTTQKRVDKNLAYNLFQFDMAQGDSDSWSPETLAVYLARVLAKDEDSPFEGMLKLGVSGAQSESTISMASVIDGILTLITSNAEKDRSELHKVSLESGRNRDLLDNLQNTAPLRELYLQNKDKSLYNLVCAYFGVLKVQLWADPEKNRIFQKTLGIHACFDFLREVARKYGARHDYSTDFFSSLLEGANSVDFSSDYYGIQTKVRRRLRDTLLVIANICEIDDLKISKDEKAELALLLQN